MQYDNPAGRLLEILVAVKRHPKNAEAREVWRAVFGLPKVDLGPILSAKLGTAMLLSQQALDLLAEDHPELIEPPPSWAIQVSGAFQVHNVHGTIDTFANSISDDTIANVRTAAVLLNKGSNRKVLAKAELAEMKESIEAVLKDVLNTDDLATDLRHYLARALRKIVVAIDEYELTGATPILESIEQAVGHVMVDAEYKSFLRDSELGQRVFNALQAASGIVTIAVGMPALTLAVQQLLK